MPFQEFFIDRPTSRKSRNFVPSDHKDEYYWSKRRKNNEAARRSREKRRVNDLILEHRVLELLQENKELKCIILRNKIKNGELKVSDIPSEVLLLTNEQTTVPTEEKISASKVVLTAQDVAAKTTDLLLLNNSLSKAIGTSPLKCFPNVNTGQNGPTVQELSTSPLSTNSNVPLKSISSVPFATTASNNKPHNMFLKDEKNHHTISHNMSASESDLLMKVCKSVIQIKEKPTSPPRHNSNSSFVISPLPSGQYIVSPIPDHSAMQGHASISPPALNTSNGSQHKSEELHAAGTLASLTQETKSYFETMQQSSQNSSEMRKTSPKTLPHKLRFKSTSSI